MHPHNVLVTVTGSDRPGVISALFAALAAHDVEVLDVEQVVIRGRLVLGVALVLHGDPGALRRAATLAAEALGTEIEVTVDEEATDRVLPRRSRHHVIVLGRPLRAGAVGEIARRIADLGGNLDTISRLGEERAIGLELMVTGADHDALAATLVTVALETGTDIAMERAGLRRRAKRLVLLDADKTLLPADTLGELAVLAGRGDESAALVEAARQAELVPGYETAPERGDRFVRADHAGYTAATTATAALVAGAVATGSSRREAELLRARVGLLAGLPVAAVAKVQAATRWAPGAGGLVAALRRMGYRCGAVSGGAAQVVEPLLDELGLDFAVANRLEVAGKHLTGRLVDAGLDPASKVQALIRFADAYGVPLSQTVAVGGLGGIDMLACAGLGVAVGSSSPAAANRPPVPRRIPGAGKTPPVGTDPTYAESLLVVLGLPAEDMGELRRGPLPASER
jgi:phosphoserine phosphatase